MSKSEFTKGFQNSIVEYLRHIIINEWDCNNLVVESETKPVSDWIGHPDIWIGKEASERHLRKPNIVSIEIEHKSDWGQAFTNVNHVIRWVKSAQKNRGALLHLIHSESNFTDNKLDIILKQGLNARSKRFDYDFRIYDIKNLAKSKREARDKVTNNDFQWALWQQLVFVKLVK
jgi:hypothetical protein